MADLGLGYLNSLNYDTSTMLSINFRKIFKINRIKYNKNES